MTLSINCKWKLFVVVADNKRHNRGGLHNLTAPHVLTENPGPDDQILAVFDGHKTHSTNTGRLVGALLHVSGHRLLSHAGRSAMIGEDGLEDAFGADALRDLVPELLTGCSWRYAPVEAVPIGEDDDYWIRWTVEDFVARDTDSGRGLPFPEFTVG